MSDDGISNHSDNTTFGEVLTARLSRRTVMSGGLATAALAFFGGGTAAAKNGAGNGTGGGRPGSSGLIGFSSTPLDAGAVPTIATPYRFEVILPWGQRIDGSADDFSRDALYAGGQASRIGIGHDGMWYFGDDQRGLLCLNHEFGSTSHVLGKPTPTNAADVQVMLETHGVSVLMIERGPNGWRLVDSPQNRRIHGNTPVTFSGPAASSPLLQTAAGNEPVGTLNNCANGYTPWGTYLTCEENFNGYFGVKTGGAWTATDGQKRYGFSANGFGYAWDEFVDRFDLSNAQYTNEENRFGWVVEIDPNDPSAAPVKRTALGRIKHENAEVVTDAAGHAVVYMGDDERFEYIYKFVSARPWAEMRADGVSPLDEGTLYVARFASNGSGQWVAMPNTVDALVFTRSAADALGATKMDRPEWITTGADGQVYCTLTNNTSRTNTDRANPQAPNPWGHIIRWREKPDDVTAFTWDIFVLASHVTENDVQMFGSPDGLWADPDGRIFIQTDGAQPGGYNDQMLVGDVATKEIRRLFSGVKGCEVTGVAVTPDRRTMFVNLQHPGDGDPTLTNFPVLKRKPDGVTIPRDATVVITRKDGGVIGS